MATLLRRLGATCRKLCLYGCATSLVITLIGSLLGWLLMYKPMIAKLAYEEWVHSRMVAGQSHTSTQPPHASSDMMTSADRGMYGNKHVSEPIIHGVPQLWSFSANEQLRLYNESIFSQYRGYGRGPKANKWIYFGGTNPSPPSLLSRLSLGIRANGSCVDPPAMCNMFNAAFDRLAREEASKIDSTSIPHASLMFTDCDVNGPLCDTWAINPVMMANVRTTDPCVFKTDVDDGRPTLKYVCSVQYAYIGLPLTTLPYNRNVKIANKLVPAFPSEYEQLRSLVVYDGSTEAVKNNEEVSIDLLDVDNIEDDYGPPIELGASDGMVSDAVLSLASKAAQEYRRLREYVV
ncbi:hypothetical protein CAC42_3681 [Sphaceloma murrayae]|uniref:Uncharacterized protein n=1 Tax=Sphaceloma murrayae TaxID=2082308 RepID=A0A2K1QGV4_9PEZI|nr:hypothetical protein CAC42_3681 [Sphaceloma murrayae]